MLKKVYKKAGQSPGPGTVLPVGGDWLLEENLLLEVVRESDGKCVSGEV